MTKQPSYRFVGCTEAWEQRKLGDVGETYTGLSGKTKEDFGHGEGKFITYVNVFNNPLTDLYGLDSVEIDDKQRRVQYGDVLFTTSSETPEDVGLSSVWMGTEDNVYLNSFCFGYRPQKGIFDLYYLAFVLRSFSVRKEFMLLAQGISRFNISKTKVMDMSIHVPSLPEQTAIGSFFQDIDQLISLQQRKLEVLKEQKKTYLKLLFPAKGQIKPALRFAGFEDEWKEVKLGEVTDRYDNLRVPVSANERVSGATPYYGANGIQDYVDGYTHDGEFILIAEDGASDLKDYPVQYVNGKVWVNNHAHVIQGKNNLINNIFLLFAVKQINIEPFLVGGGRTKLNSDIMMKLPLHLPSLPEQEAIGSFFQDLDKAIAKQEEKVNQLKESKQTLLRKMFI